MHRQLSQAIVGMLLLAALLAACGQSPMSTAPAARPTAAAPDGDVEPVFAFSEAVAGKNRIAIGLVRSNTPLNDPSAKIHMRFFNLDENNGQVKFEADTTYYGQGLPGGFYVAYPTFDKPGNWGVEIQAQASGQAQPTTRRFQLTVNPSSEVPTLGQPAITATTPIARDVPDLTQISSDPTPDPALYQISLDQALKNGKPTALLFATPAFCKTATCGPSIEVLRDLQKQYGERVNFIHVEVYKYPFDQSVQRQERAAREKRGLTPDELRAVYADAMVAWHLQSEPWLFLIDKKGIVAGRYEGGITREEIGPALEKLIAGLPVF